jgi:flagellar hook-length control protein FliK
MGITLVSNTTVSGTINGAGTPGAADAVPGDFAALLSMQILGAFPQKPNDKDWLTNLPGEIRESFDRADTTDAGEGANTTDPAVLAAMLGIPSPPPSPPTIITPDKHGLSQVASDEALPLARPNNLLISEHHPQETVKEELMAAGISRQGPQVAAPRSETANIAGDLLPTSELTSNFGPAMSNAISQRHTMDVVQTAISPPLHSKAWPGQLGEKIIWIARSDQQSAQININPPQLGPLQITLHLSGDQANAIFASPHPEVRQAIEAAMPLLREMLQSAGINLGDASVGANLAQQNQNNPFTNPNRNQAGHENAILPANADSANAGASPIAQRGNGLVDLFA